MNVAATATFPAATELRRADGRAETITSLPVLEQRLAAGLGDEWTSAVASDPHASLFQTPAWCMAWYRAYADLYDPLIVLVRDGARLVGLVPLAVGRASRQLLFAGGSMADYRDVVAVPEHRRLVLDRLVDVFLGGAFPDPFSIGWLDPGSETQRVVEDICRQRGLRYVVHQQPCYRWFPPPPAKPSAQKFLNWFKRQGDVSFDIIESPEHWAAFRDEYFRQHSLRQIQAGRATAFDDPRHRLFYDALFHSPDVHAHVTAFRLAGKTLAGHFGHVWRGVLLLGPPSIDLEHEQRSPAVILLSWIIQNAERLGLTGFDLTIGDSDFKKRLGNRCVTVATIEIYARRTTFIRQRVRTALLGSTRTVITAIAGPMGWNRIKRASERLGYKLGRMREEGLVATIGAMASTLRRALIDHRRGHVYTIGPVELRPVAPRLGSSDRFEVHENRIDDLLLWNGGSLTTKSAITGCARSYARVRHANGTLHTVVLNGTLAGWGYSYYPSAPAQLTETPGATLVFEPGAVSLYDFHVLPEFRGRRVYQALLTTILERRFAEGAPLAYITVLASNRPSRAAIERVGFRLTAANVYWRILAWSSLRSAPVP